MAEAVRLRNVLLAALVFGCVTAGAAPPKESTATTTIDPACTVYRPPNRIFGLSPSEDRFEIEITWTERSPSLAALHLSFSIAHDGVPLVTRTGTFPVSGGQYALIRETGIVPVWETIRRGRLVGLWHAWNYDGFALNAEVRENGPDGHLIYHHYSPNHIIGISRRGFYDQYVKPITLGGIAFFILLSQIAARFTPPGPKRGAEIAFDLSVLMGLSGLTLAFSRYAMIAIWPVAVLLALIPGRLKQGAALGAGGALRAGWRAVDASISPSWAPAAASIAVAAWLLAWHVSLLQVFGFNPADFSEYLKLLSALYLAASLVIVMPLHALIARRVRCGRPIRAIIAAAACFFLVWVAVRTLDWGAFFFSAGHIDEDFWSHAFYGQVLTILRERSMQLLLAAAIGSAGLLGVLLWNAVRFGRWTAALGLRQHGLRPISPLLWSNAAITVGFVVVLASVWPLVLMPSGRTISDSIREAFSGVPEVKVAASLAHTLLERESADPPVLDVALVEKLRQAGIRLNALDPRYPLMKPSIYLDPLMAAKSDRPRAAPATNVIVILAESLSAWLVDERIHGVAGLTPHIDDFRAHSFTFRNLYSADFPTIKGELAALASYAFDHSGLPITADSGNPLKSRYLFLSDVLSRQCGYSAYHLQSDYASFAGTASILGRHSYERIYSAEDAELRRRAAHPIEKTWGLYDEDLFRAVTGMIAEGAFRPPFLLTLATTDLHFPYATLRRHPGTHGNVLLDAVHSQDAAFGVFWEAFKRSPRAADTVVLLTADHALVRSLVKRGGEGGGGRSSVFDYVFGALYVPGSDRWAGGGTDATCTQLDLLPTLLDVLGVDIPNPFLGLSIFAERPQHPMALAREIPTERWSPSDRAAAMAIGWTPGDHQQFLEFLRNLAVTNRVLPPGN